MQKLRFWSKVNDSVWILGTAWHGVKDDEGARKILRLRLKGGSGQDGAHVFADILFHL